MNIIEFKDRKVILWTMPDGEKQPFYLSTGRNSRRSGTWFPFDGYIEPHGRGWFNKYRFCNDIVPEELHRFGKRKYQKVSKQIEAFFELDLEFHSERHTGNGIDINEFLIEEGWTKRSN